MIFWKGSKCKKNKYCGFIEYYEDDRAKVEICQFCSRKEIYRKVGGRIDNRKYLAAHVRDFAQRNGPTAKIFEELYGKLALINFDEAAKTDAKKSYMRSYKGISEKQQQSLDFFRTLGRTSV